MELANAIADSIIETIAGDSLASVTVRQEIIEKYAPWVRVLIAAECTVVNEKTVDEDDGAEPEVCLVCFDELTIGATMRVLPCGHRYHAECAERWFVESILCPTCRASLQKDLTNNLSNVENEVLREAIVLEFSADLPQPLQDNFEKY